MATETLDDNKPKPLENEAKDEPEPKSEAEVAEQDAEIVESEEKKEIDEHEDSEKDDGDDEDEGGDEDDGDGDDEEEEDAGEKEKEKEKKGVKKEALSEKKSPVTPSDRPTRERKMVERYSEPSPLNFGRSSSSKGLIIEKDRGTQLKDIPNGWLRIGGMLSAVHGLNNVDGRIIFIWRVRLHTSLDSTHFNPTQI